MIFMLLHRERGREKENNLVPLKINDVKEGILKQFCRNVI